MKIEICKLDGTKSQNKAASRIRLQYGVNCYFHNGAYEINHQFAGYSAKHAEKIAKKQSKPIQLHDEYEITFHGYPYTHDDIEIESRSPQFTYLTIDGAEYIAFENRETAGEAAREYWQDMNANGPGTTKVSSLEEWLDLWLDIPEEHFASYDGQEVQAHINDVLKEELDWDSNNIVMYRTS